MKDYRILLLVVIFLFACNLPVGQQATQVPVVFTVTTENSTNTPESILTFTPTFTPTFTETVIPSPTFTPSITPSPTITATPTFVFPAVTVNKQAHCRYGPSQAYLHAADLYAGDTGTVRGRFIYSKWLFIKFDKLNYFCWVAPSVVDVVGDISKIKLTELNLQAIGSNMYGPPTGVMASRDGVNVTISWNQVIMTDDDDRGYFIEAFVCQGGAYLWWTFSYPNQFTTSYTVKDEAGCAQPSFGKLYTVEKHGYSEPVTIPWPAP